LPGFTLPVRGKQRESDEETPHLERSHRFLKKNWPGSDYFGSLVENCREQATI
jgi:hypothetical protein